MRPSVRARAHTVTEGTHPRTCRSRVRTLIAAIGALLVLGIAAGTAVAQTSSTRLASGVVVIKTRLGYEDGAAAGTGMVLTSSGEVLTNNHVIRGATAIKIVVPNTGRTYTAQHRRLRRVRRRGRPPGGRGIEHEHGDDQHVEARVGASVTAIGNAGGTGRLASATGRITRLGDSVVVGDDEGGAVRLTGMIGVNASVVPGDSGGPLMNSSGEVIGMDTAGSAGATFRSTNATQAYAIPITKALSIATKIMAGTGSARIHIGETAFLGVQIAGGFRGRHSGGAAVAGVTPGTPAATAGLTPGDVVTARQRVPHLVVQRAQVVPAHEEAGRQRHDHVLGSVRRQPLREARARERARAVALVSGEWAEHVFDGTRPAGVEALGVVDALGLEHVACLLVGDELGDGLACPCPARWSTMALTTSWSMGC